jgi:hypothetical protein
MGDAGDMTVLPKIHGTGNGGKQKIFPAKIGYLWIQTLTRQWTLKQTFITKDSIRNRF